MDNTSSGRAKGPPDSHHHDAERDLDRPRVYQIRIKGHLGRQWMHWFEGLVITWEENGDTLLTGPVIDQAALHGLLKKVRDLGMPLLSLTSSELHISTPH